jgi:DNA-binding PadR family transcriptional regulator
MRRLGYTGANVSHSVLDIYLLSLIDRGLSTRYDLQRRGGVSLGSSTPALKRLQLAGLVTEREADDGTMRIRQVLNLTPAGRRVSRKAWRDYFRQDANLDVEAILRVVDIARYEAVPRGEIVEFLNTMASQRSALLANTDQGVGDGVVDLQDQLLAYRATAESKFLKDLAKSHSQSRKSVADTNQPRIKVRRNR